MEYILARVPIRQGMQPEPGPERRSRESTPSSPGHPGSPLMDGTGEVMGLVFLPKSHAVVCLKPGEHLTKEETKALDEYMLALRRGRKGDES